MEWIIWLSQQAVRHPWWTATAWVVSCIAIAWLVRRAVVARKARRARQFRLRPRSQRRDWKSTVYNPVEFRRPRK